MALRLSESVRRCGLINCLQTTDHEVIPAGWSACVAGAAGCGGSTGSLLAGANCCNTQTKDVIHCELCVVNKCNVCVNAFRIGSSKASLTPKSCACASLHL
jgi:hypothetical protein